MRIRLAFVLAGLILNYVSSAQSIHVHITDGSVVTHPLVDVRTITFSDNVMNLTLVTGDTISWNVSVVSYYEYEQDPTSITEHGSVVSNMINAYPTPSNGPVTIEYELKEPVEVNLAIYSLNGAMVEQLQHGQQPGGLNRIVWNGNTTAGVYLCKLSSVNVSYHKLIVLTDQK
jgi:hypothetical protein